jgi:HSP20 family protein
MNRSNPFDEIQRAFERMNRQFQDGGQWGEWGIGGAAGSPGRGISLDVAEYDDQLVVMADLPGYEREEIDLTIDGDSLRIRAERTHADEHEGDDRMGRYVRRERRHEAVTRSVTLPARVEESGASATYANGVLTVRLPKVDAAASDAGHRIDIE